MKLILFSATGMVGSGVLREALAMRKARWALCILVAGVALGEDFERRLIPIAAAATPGAYGTIWITRVQAVQELESAKEIIGNVTMNLPRDHGRSTPYDIVLSATQNEPPGAIVYVPKAASASIHLGARLEQRGTMPGETVLPVVAESRFVSRPLFFLQLTNARRQRTHLRAYSLNLDHASITTRLRIHATWTGKANGWSVVHEQELRLTSNPFEVTSLDGSISLPARPLAAEILLDPLLHQYPEGAQIAVSISPLDPNVSLWGMVSETDVETQRVLITEPN